MKKKTNQTLQQKRDAWNKRAKQPFSAVVEFAEPAQIKVKETRFPRLTQAILRRLDREQLADVARHGADSGWSGFTYYTDTCAFYKAHKADILKMAEDLASALGEDMLHMIQNFRCLTSGSYPNRKPDFSQSEIAEALYSGRGEHSHLIRNAMAWFALEEVARELNPDL